MTAPRADRLAGDRASATVEMVLVMPVLLGFLFLLVLAGRLVDARSDIVGAANDAARAASLQYDGGAAEVQAQRAADDTVAGERLNCVGGPDVQTDFVAWDSGAPTEFQRGANVRVTVTCNVRTGDLMYFGWGPTRQIREVAWEPIDQYRSG